MTGLVGVFLPFVFYCCFGFRGFFVYDVDFFLSVVVFLFGVFWVCSFPT